MVSSCVLEGLWLGWPVLTSCPGARVLNVHESIKLYCNIQRQPLLNSSPFRIFLKLTFVMKYKKTNFFYFLSHPFSNERLSMIMVVSKEANEQIKIMYCEGKYWKSLTTFCLNKTQGSVINVAVIKCHALENKPDDDMGLHSKVNTIIQHFISMLILNFLLWKFFYKCWSWLSFENMSNV